jgi:hypothetical protein
MTKNCSPPNNNERETMYNFTIKQGKKTILQFADRNAVKAHSLVTTANTLAKYKTQQMSYTYTYAK